MGAGICEVPVNSIKYCCTCESVAPENIAAFPVFGNSVNVDSPIWSVPGAFEENKFVVCCKADVVFVATLPPSAKVFPHYFFNTCVSAYNSRLFSASLR